MDLSLAEFCQHYETVELWFDTKPNAQLQLIWLLDYFRSYPNAVQRLKFRLVDLAMIELGGSASGRRRLSTSPKGELKTASAAWQAYRAPTPEACFDLLGKDLSALPLLKPVLIDLLEELPSGSTGLGATEMRMLELIARGYSLTNRALPSLPTAANAHLRRVGIRLLAGWAGVRAQTGRGGPRRRAAHARPRKFAGPAPSLSAQPAVASPNSARLFSPTRKTSAGTIQSTAGGAARI